MANDMQGVEVALIGAGRMGVRHGEAVQGLGMHIVGIADILEDSRVSAGDMFAVPRGGLFSDARDMLSKLRPAAVVVATTAPSHAELVLASIASGARFILCEKPFASSLEQADRMIFEASQNDCRLAVNHQMRFMPNYTQVKSLVGSAELGALVSMVVTGSNFGLAMNASHYFEAFRYLTDGPVESVRAWFEPGQLANPRGPMFDDRSGRLLATGSNGESLFIDFSAKSGWGLQVTYICELGQIFVDEIHGSLRIAAREPEFRTLPTSRYGMPAIIREMHIPPVETVEPTMAVWRAMGAGNEYPSGEDGTHALACLVAAHVSDRNNGSATRLDSPEIDRAEKFHWA